MQALLLTLAALLYWADAGPFWVLFVRTIPVRHCWISRAGMNSTHRSLVSVFETSSA